MIDRRRIWGQLDGRVIILTLVLAVIGIINLFSATINMPGEGLPFYVRQLCWFGIGVLFCLLALIIDYRYYKEFAYLFYLVALVAVLCVLVYGLVAGGGQRWVKIGFFYFQPSELMKIALILALARYFAQHERREGYRLRDLFIPAIITIVPALLIVKQPDLGTAMVMVLIFFSMVLFVNIRLKSLLILCLAILLTTPFFWLVLKDYQRTRVLTLLHPEMDPLGTGYHIIQSKIAIGSGGLLGKGFLQGTQCKLHFLPEHHTDFIFAVLGEEWGFVGCMVVLALYMALILWGVTRGIRTQDRYGSIIAFGVTAMIFWHVVINVGMVLGIMPVVGLPLPFLSYGGSSTVVTLIGIGLLLNVRARRHIF
jgi:rod shape determining protein RodA